MILKGPILFERFLKWKKSRVKKLELFPDLGPRIHVPYSPPVHFALDKYGVTQYTQAPAWRTTPRPHPNPTPNPYLKNSIKEMDYRRYL